MRVRSIVLATVIVPLLASIAWGQAPLRLTYQGELTEDDCHAEGTYAMDFSIWSSLTNGSLIYQHSEAAVPVTQGRFSVEIPVANDTFLSSGRYLEITVEGATLSPRERITSAAYSLRTRGLWVDENLNVGIQTTTPDAALDVHGDAVVRDTVNVGNRVGVGGPDPAFLWGQLTVVDSGDGAAFAISADWDHDSLATIFASNSGSGGVLYAYGSSDAEPDGGGVIVAGDEAGLNVAIDGNEIMARDSGATSALYLNNNGGDVVVGGTLDIGWQFISEIRASDSGYGTLHCPAGKRPLGGGCSSQVGIEEVEKSAPFCDADGCGWECNMTGSEDVRIRVICARVK